MRTRTKGRTQLKRKAPQKGAGRKTKPNPENDSSAAQQLLTAARGLFARKGLTGTSIRDIAEAAKVNSALISYHFKNKEGLYRACIEQIAGASVEMTRKVLQPAKTEAEFRLRMQMFLDSIFALFLEDRDTGLILIREYDRLHSPAEQVFRDSFLTILNSIVTYFAEAQKIGLVDQSKDAFTLAGLFFGCVTSQMRVDHLQEKTYKKSLRDPAEKRKVEEHIVDLFTLRPKRGK